MVELRNNIMSNNQQLIKHIRNISLKDIASELVSLCSVDIPTGTVVYLGKNLISGLTKKFDLPSPKLLGGNLIIGDITKAKYVLTAHLDEISFGITSVNNEKIIVAPYHSFEGHFALKIKEVTIIGVRNSKLQEIGKGALEQIEQKIFLKTDAAIKIGDRLVYRFKPVIEKDWLAAKALDDRVGALTALLSASLLKKLNISNVVILSDGEECNPNGYFSRNFPFALRHAPDNCVVAFIDGAYKPDLIKSGEKSLPTSSFIPAHTSDGKGLIVEPLLFGYLRDKIIPYCSKQGFPAKVETSYRSRGDEWGMVMDPAHSASKYGFLADFGCWEEKVHNKLIQIVSPESIINLMFLLGTVGQELPNILDLIRK